MIQIFLLQYQAPEFALQFIVAATIILFLITLYLFAASILVRNAKLREEYYFKKRTEMYYPHILDYISDSSQESFDLQSHLRKDEEISTFVRIVGELIETVEGDEQERLRELLTLPNVRKFYFRMLSRRDKDDLITACLYYANIHVLTPEEYNLLRSLLRHSNLLVAHTSATAILTSPEVERRIEALEAMATRQRVSRLAMLEMIYLFQYQAEDQMDAEVDQLSKFIRNRELLETHVAIVIKGICDIGYATMVLDLYDILSEGSWDDSEHVLEALIYAMGRFEFGDAASLIVSKYSSDERPRVRRACAAALGMIADPGFNETLAELAKDPEFAVRLKAIYSLAATGDAGKTYLSELAERESDLRVMIRGVLAEVEGGKV